MGKSRRTAGTPGPGERSEQSSLDHFLRSAAVTGPGAEIPNMAPASQLTSAAAGRTGGRDVPARSTQSGESSDEEEEGDPYPAPDLAEISNYLKLLPTKLDLERFASRLEGSYKKEIQALKGEFTARVEEVEKTQEGVMVELQAQRKLLESHSAKIDELLYNQEDLENRNRRNNIRIRGLPESVSPPDLNRVTQQLFNNILDEDPDKYIELDRVHRALAPPPSPEARPRDVICRVHHYRIKEAIMSAARLKKQITFLDAPIILLQDLARRTLQQRRALKPLLASLKDNGVPYRWGFPFQLTATRDGRSATFRKIDDLSLFLDTFGLPKMDLPEWQSFPQLPTPPSRWQRIRKDRSSRKKTPPRSSPSAPHGAEPD